MNDDNDGPNRAPACDACRSRKIKCDREVPCGSCRGWKITCQTTQRHREKKQRVLISHKYENEFRDLNRKLENLSVTLQSFVDNPKPGDPGSQTLHSQVVDVLASVKHERDEDEGLFQGESSFPAQWKDVAQIYETELNESPSNSDNSGLMNPMSDVGRSPAKSSLSRDSPAAPNPDTLSSNFPQLAHLPLPPTTHVLNALRIAKVYLQKVFSDFPFQNLDRTTTMCQKVFFPTEDFTLATYIVVNCLLVYLFRDMDEAVAEKISMTKEEQYKCAEICSNNVYVSMKFWNLGVEPSPENIEALVLGAFILMEDCHMFRTWTAMGFACRLLQDAGFHRQAGLDGLSIDERRHRKWLFWTAYSFDHALSLNFGRTANLQDWDITIELPDFPPEAYIHGQQILFWINLARHHGQIYKRLYSARALQSPQDVRTAAARELATATLKLKEHFEPFYEELATEDYSRGATAATQVVLLSTLTMIYKCIPPTSAVAQDTPKPLQFGDDCITTARNALTTLNKVWGSIEQRKSEVWRLFIHWCLVGSPFLPFVVIFGTAMNVPNNVEDYKLLLEVGRTIESAAGRSPGLTKLHSICQNFLKVVKSRYEPAIPPPPSNEAQITVPQQDMQFPMQSSVLPGEFGYSEHDPSAFNFMDFSMLDGWELGPDGAESAREMNSYFGQFPQSGFMGSLGRKY